MKINTDEINRKKKELIIIREELKQIYFGIDAQIDAIFEKIKTWYAAPVFESTPVIINLWGLTGVGKTALVRSIVNAFKLRSRYVEVQMNSGINDPSSSLMRIFNSNNIQPKTKSIILLDEFQKFRTIDESGKERLNQNGFNDIWELMSDGKLTDNRRRLKRLEHFKSKIEDAIVESNKMKLNPTYEPASYTRSRYSSAIYPWETAELSRYINVSDSDLKYALDHRKLNLQKEYMGNMSDMAVMYDVVNIDKTDLTDIQTMLTKLSNEEIHYLITRSIDNMNNVDIDDTNDVFSNMLIFTSGNLDKLFSNNEYSNDIEKLYKYISSLKLSDIKDELITMFKAEQLARMGNNHIIFPSINRDSFKAIIKKELNKIEKTCLTNYNITVSLTDDSIIDLIFDVGVYANQGARPVNSTISSIVSSILPEFLLLSTEHDISKFSVEYDKSKKRVMSPELNKKVSDDTSINISIMH